MFFLAAIGVARAENHADVDVTYFVEPGSTPAGATGKNADQQLHVVHPAAAIGVDAGSHLTFSLGYDADIVSGATARTYSKVDAVSSATTFSDVRHAFHGGLTYRAGPVTLDGGYTYAFEHDYRSHVVNAGVAVDLLGHNTTFALSYAHNFDSVCDADNRGNAPLERIPLADSSKCFTTTPGIRDEALAIDAYQASWTQVLTRVWLMQLTAGLEVLDGFQSNPYRRVRLFDGQAEAQESEPTLRQRMAIQARLRWALPWWRASIGAEGRFYWDTWDIKSVTAQLDLQKYIGEHFLFRARGRYYEQTRALFYRDAGEALSYEAVGPVGQYFTGDRELSPFRDFLVGVKLSYLKSADEHGRVARMFNDVEISVKLDAIKYQSVTPLPPNYPRYNGLGGIISALVAQLGIGMRF